MGSRLKLIASLAERGVGVADVGTDHGILPITLRQSGYTGRIVASDINVAPLEKARRALEQTETENVELCLCNGLDGIDGSGIDTIVVAGMGGDTITGILDRGLYDLPQWSERNDYRLILHPVTKPEILRYWLVNNGFEITDDILVEDNGVLCQIICAHMGESIQYKDCELYIGKYEHISSSEHFLPLADKHIKRFESAAKGINSSGDESLAAWRDMLLSMARELREMEERYYDECKTDI